MLVPKYVDIALEVEEMYFEAASSAFYQAESFADIITTRNGNLHRLIYGEAYDYGDEIDFDEEEWTNLKRAEEQLADAFGRFVQSVALTHILCIMALEAHINMVAQEQFVGKTFEEFDKLSVKGKWLILPGIAGKQTMDPGKQPYQGFSHMIRRRNALVHPKTNELQELLTKSGDPNILLQKGLQDASESLETTENMIIELAQLLSSNKPKWLNNRNHKFYSLSISQNDASQ